MDAVFYFVSFRFAVAITLKLVGAAQPAGDLAMACPTQGSRVFAEQGESTRSAGPASAPGPLCIC